jgi:superfamily II DNA or RNA helicase
MPELRPYQRDAIDAARDALRTKHSTLLLMPTGCGKTVVFAEIARMTVERGHRVLVLAHRNELLDQARDKLAAAGVEAAIEKGAKRAGDAAVVVASVQSLKGKRLAEFERDAFRLVVIDEAHHAAAKSYRDIVTHFDQAKVIGVTATGDRADGQGLGKVFDSVAYRYGLADAIQDGWLSPLRAYRVRCTGLDLDTINVRGDFHQGQLAEALRVDRQLHEVVVPTLKDVGDRPTIMFGVNVEHAFDLARVLNGYRPGCAMAVSGADKPAVRAEAVRAFMAGEVQFLVNCALYVEGFDAPNTAAVVIARPTKSRALFTQMVGRGTRLAPGKTDCLILDFVGNATKHRLAGPADILSDGEVPEPVQEIALELMRDNAELDLIDAVAEAEKRHGEHLHRLALQAKAKWFAEQVDILGERDPIAETPYSGGSPSDRQLAFLGTQFKRMEIPDNLTRGEASSIIDKLTDRRRRGLATLKQARRLRSWGNPDAFEISAKTASERIEEHLAYLKAERGNQW